MRTLLRGATLLLIGAVLTGCIANSTHTTRSSSAKPGNAGMQARDIRGTDADGKAFQLSDYRGKVVLLDFWGSWCGPCRSMFDHERSLVEKYEGRPFVLLGVAVNDDRETLQEVQKKHKLNWRSWCDEDGTIAQQWRVEAFPTLYLIDPKGMIRWHHVAVPDSKSMDERIEQLVKEAESDSGKQASLSRK